MASFAQTPATSSSTLKPESEVVELSVFSVNADKDKGYGATNSIAGSRVNVPLREIPSYTISLNEQFLKDVGAVDMLDAINYVSGVRTAGQGQGDTQYQLRGYAQSGNGTVYRDGLPDRDRSEACGSTSAMTKVCSLPEYERKDMPLFLASPRERSSAGPTTISPAAGAFSAGTMKV